MSFQMMHNFYMIWRSYVHSVQVACPLVFCKLPYQHLHCQNQQWKHQNDAWNLFLVNNKYTRMTSVTSLWSLTLNKLYTLFRYFHRLIWTSKCDIKLHRKVDLAALFLYFHLMFWFKNICCHHQYYRIS